GIADLLRVLKHLKFALNVAFFVRHEYFLHPKSGNLQEVSRESVHIHTAIPIQQPSCRSPLAMACLNGLCSAGMGCLLGE
ncbi:MAG: hypothetical protein P8N30_06445, partial [Tateyamaria sp.]|nr:hypothetical protein [Tateyamaria sp.]